MPIRWSALAGRAALVATVAFAAGAAFAADNEVNVYTTREPGLIQPLLDTFTKETGIKTNTVFIESGIAERLQAEGENSPADVIMVVDYGMLEDMVERGLTQAVKSDVLDAAVPANLRDPDGHWFAMSMRARVIYASKERVTEDSMTYEDLADPKWKGRVCIRSGQHPYNNALFAAMIAKDGEAKTEEYLTALKANLARTAGGGDRDVARDILADICDIGLGNSYYVGLMRSGTGGPDQQEWGERHQGDPADLRRSRRHARQHLRRRGRQIRAAPRQRPEAARIPRLARGAGRSMRAATTNIRCSPAPRSIRSSPRSAISRSIRCRCTRSTRTAAPQASSSTRSASIRRCDAGSWPGR